MSSLSEVTSGIRDEGIALLHRTLLTHDGKKTPRPASESQASEGGRVCALGYLVANSLRLVHCLNHDFSDYWISMTECEGNPVNHLILLITVQDKL